MILDTLAPLCPIGTDGSPMLMTQAYRSPSYDRPVTEENYPPRSSLATSLQIGLDVFVVKVFCLVELNQRSVFFVRRMERHSRFLTSVRANGYVSIVVCFDHFVFSHSVSKQKQVRNVARKQCGQMMKFEAAQFFQKLLTNHVLKSI